MAARGILASRIAIVRRRGRDLVGALMAYRDGGTPVAKLCDRTAAAVDEYSQFLSDNLTQARSSLSTADTDWLRREYVTILGEFALKARDIIPDREDRHALAQAIQCAVLRHERRLREVTSPAVQA